MFPMPMMMIMIVLKLIIKKLDGEDHSNKIVEPSVQDKFRLPYEMMQHATLYKIIDKNNEA